MRLVDRIRELCATAANTNDPVTAFQALQELREITRDRDFRRDMEALHQRSASEGDGEQTPHQLRLLYRLLVFFLVFLRQAVYLCH